MEIPILNIYYLLSYAWDKLDEAEPKTVGQIDNKNVINLDFKRENKKNIKHKLILGGAQIGMNYGFKNERIINNFNRLITIFRI